MRKRLKHFFKNKWVWAAGIVILIVIIWIASHRKSGPTLETATAGIGNVIERVSITGQVLPVDKADLAFQKSGVVSTIAVKVGDPVKKGMLLASLDKASDQASLASTQATLADMSRNLTPQELAVQQTSLDTVQRNALNASHDGLVKAQTALFTYTDVFFNSPQSVNPVIRIPTPTPTIQQSINNERAIVSDTLIQWGKDLAAASSSQAVDIAAKSRSHLSTIKNFMNDLANIVNNLTPNSSNLSQTTIDTYVSNMNSGLSTLNSAIDSVTSAQTSVASAQSDYNLKLSGNSSQSISAQAAKVSGAYAELAKDSLLSPIDGIVTRVDPQVGEFVAAGQTAFAVQTVGQYKIEAFVPEADIAKVAIGNTAAITLDAYGPSVAFPASVSMIDPAETVLEGVPTYKVTLLFNTPDTRIRSGMTANTDILTHEHDNVITVPSRALTTENGSSSIRILNSDGKTYQSVPVIPGLKGSDGMIEIMTGVNAGEKVVTYVK